MSWQIATVANAGIGISYLFIALSIIRPLARGQQLRSNPLGTVTGLLFFIGAVHFGGQSAQMLLPSFGLYEEHGLALRLGWGWPMAVWDIVGVGIAVCYWVLRRNHASLTRRALLFEDMQRREQQALELNDRVLQGLVVAKMALDLDESAKAQVALTSSIDAASQMVTELLGGREDRAKALVRSVPATVSNHGETDIRAHTDLRAPSPHTDERPTS